MSKRPQDAGIEERHSTSCPRRNDETKRCNCVPRYRGTKKDAHGKLIRSPWSTSKAQARAWRQEAVVAVRQGRLRHTTGLTVHQAGEQLIAGMRSGAILDRKGQRYKPSTIRGYERDLAKYICPMLGHRKVSSLRRADIQAYIERMRELGAAPATVHNRLDPIRVLMRRAIRNEELLVDPCAQLDLPLVRNARTRIEAPAAAQLLIDALPESEQAFWALALLAGLRRGELRALQVDDLDFDAGLVRVRRGWDDYEGEIEPKTFAGARQVPMMGELRRICLAHKLATGRRSEDLFLGRTAVDPFTSSTVRARALKAWGWKQEPAPDGARQKDGRPKLVWVKDRQDALEPLTPHEARHCAASYMIAAGLDWKKITTFIGHSDVRTSFNRYGKIVPEDLDEAAAKMDAYYARHHTRE